MLLTFSSPLSLSLSLCLSVCQLELSVTPAEKKRLPVYRGRLAGRELLASQSAKAITSTVS